MTCRNPGHFNSHGLLRLVTSIFVGSVIGILFAVDILPVTPEAVRVNLWLGVLSLIFVFIDVGIASVNPHTSLYRSLRSEINYLLSGTIGTILSALALLIFSPTVQSIPTIVLIAIDAFFLSQMLAEWVVVLNCALRNRIHEDSSQSMPKP